MKKLTLIYLLMSTTVFSQSIGDWKIYSDMKDSKMSLSTNNGFWVVTTGGAYFYNTEDNSFIKLTKAEGLNSQVLTAMCSDNDQKIWFGSQEGYINIFNPSDNNVDRIMDIFNTGKTQKQINQLVSSNDTIFAATDFGLSLINSNNLSFYDSFMKFGDFPTESKVLNVYKKSLIYIITEMGIAIQKEGAQNLSVPESWNSYPFGGKINATSAKKLLHHNNQLLLAANNGIHRFDGTNWALYLLQNENIVDMTVQGNSIYFLTANKLYAYVNNQLTTIYENYDIALNSINVVDLQTFYIASNKGMIELKSGNEKLIFPDGPLANKFINLASDQNGNIWAATGKNGNGVGVMKFDGNSWTYFNNTNTPELQSNDIINVSTYGNDVLLSNWGKGFSVFSNEIFNTYNTLNSDIVGVSENPDFVSISAVQSDSKGNIWAANNQTASRKQLSVLTKDNKWYHYNVSPLSADALGTMVIDQYDTKWFVSTINNAGVYYFNEKNTFTNLSDDTQGYLTSSDGLITNSVSSLAIDKRGQLWIGTSEGINLVSNTASPKASLTNRVAFSVRNQTVTCIAVDPLDNKWIGTKQGVFVLSSDGIQLIDYYTTKNSPMPSDDIKSITVNPKTGVVYIGTDFGLAALTTSSLQPEESFNELFVYPNPLIIDGSNTTATIDGLIKDTSIKIIDVSGKSIRTFVTPGGRVASWDGRDDDGKYVATGIYIIVAYDNEANNVATAKVAVIRK